VSNKYSDKKEMKGMSNRK